MLLDLGLPGLDGLEVISSLRGWSQVPILVLSARGEESDKVTALDAGADDYVAKPFGMGELLARMRAVLRRRQPDVSDPVHRTAAFQVDLATKQSVRLDLDDAGPVEVRLTPIEWGLVEVLVRNSGRLVARGELLREVWGPQHEKDTNYLRVHIANLRGEVGARAVTSEVLPQRAGHGVPLPAGLRRPGAVKDPSGSLRGVAPRIDQVRPPSRQERVKTLSRCG